MPGKGTVEKRCPNSEQGTERRAGKRTYPRIPTPAKGNPRFGIAPRVARNLRVFLLFCGGSPSYVLYVLLQSY